MKPANFPQANIVFKPPADLHESQCEAIPACRGTVKGGHLDGSDFVVVAWQPDEVDLAEIMEGKPIFLICLGGIPPHTLHTKFPFTLEANL